MKKKTKSEHPVDENFFREMNYEIAGEIGVIDSEEMLNNEKLLNQKKKIKGTTFKLKK